MTTTRRRRTLAERLVKIEEDRQRLMKAKVKEDARTKRHTEAAKLADEILRGAISERRRKVAWQDDPVRAQAELKLLDEELTDANERRVFGLPPLTALVETEATSKGEASSLAETEGREMTETSPGTAEQV